VSALLTTKLLVLLLSVSIVNYQAIGYNSSVVNYQAIGIIVISVVNYQAHSYTVLQTVKCYSIGLVTLCTCSLALDSCQKCIGPCPKAP